MSKFPRIFHWNKSKFLFWLLIKSRFLQSKSKFRWLSIISTNNFVEIEVEIHFVETLTGTKGQLHYRVSSLRRDPKIEEFGMKTLFWKQTFRDFRSIEWHQKHTQKSRETIPLTVKSKSLKNLKIVDFLYLYSICITLFVFELYLYQLKVLIGFLTFLQLRMFNKLIEWKAINLNIGKAYFRRTF
jgi:hypothetical protein